MNLFQKLLHDEHGFIITTELVIIATLLVIGLITGIQCLQAAVVSELKDVGGAIGSLNQSYSFTGKHGCWSWGCGRSSYTRGSCFVDEVDEYQSHVELGCLDVGQRYNVAPQVAPIIQQQTIEHPPIEVGPAPTECPPGALMVPSADCPPGSTAPDNCPPAESYPPGNGESGMSPIW